MQMSPRFGVTVFALSILAALHGPLSANAQGSEKAHPLFTIAGQGSNSIQGYTPAQIKRAYGFDKIVNQGDGQVIAIVDAFDDPNLEADLGVFDNTFNLRACTTANGCLQKISAGPGTSDPTTLSIWAFETALDVEWAHAIAPRATILLVESATDTVDSLLAAVHIAVSNGANVVSMSWGGNEFATELAAEDGHFAANHVTFFAAAGDSGHGTVYPAASPLVMSVGGTTLHLDKDGNYVGEKAWSGSGGGQSLYEPEPPYQIAYPIPNDPLHMRGMPDVAYVGDPNTGVAIYDSVPLFGSSGWFETGGTSVGPPQWSALVAIANSARDPKKRPLTGSQGVLYDAATDETFTDISNGRNGKCGTLCNAKPNYDYVTGLGTPQADNLIPELKELP